MKRLVKFYGRLGVEVAVNSLGVVRLHHDLIKDDCYYPSVTKCYNITFCNRLISPDIDSYRFVVLNPDGSIS